MHCDAALMAAFAFVMPKKHNQSVCHDLTLWCVPTQMILRLAGKDLSGEVSTDAIDFIF